jgi:hypothetical protein
MQYLAIITMEVLSGIDRCGATLALLLNVPGAGEFTRLDIYNYMRGEVAENCGEQFAHANVVYFSVEPNILST